jgi:Flp pilus assembly protein TadD
MPKKKSTIDPNYRQQFDAAITLVRDGKVALAIEALKCVALEYPNESAVHGYLGLVLFRVEQFALAVRHFEVATKLSPKSELSSLALFHALRAINKHKAAIAELKRFQSVAHSADYNAIAAEMGIRIPMAA